MTIRRFIRRPSLQLALVPSLVLLFQTIGMQNSVATLPTASTTDVQKTDTQKTGSSPLVNKKPLKVVIDPGHGGVDKGATRGKIRESTIALAVAKALGSLLRDDSRFEVFLTRDGDESRSLPERAHIAKKNKADLFISIHANASEDPRARGVEFWFQNQLPADEESLFLANRENQTVETEAGHTPKDKRISRHTDLVGILDDLQRNYRISASGELSSLLYEHWLGTKGRQRNTIRQAPFYVVSEVPVPSVLVELGFLSHDPEGLRMADPEFQKQSARSLYNGIVAFKEIFDRDRRVDRIP